MAKGDLGLSVKAKWISDEDELFSFFKTLGKKYAKKIYRRAIRKVANQVMTEMKIRAPEDSGALVSSMVVRKPPKSGATSYGRGEIVLGAMVHGPRLAEAAGHSYPYFLAIEYGTSKMSPDPFLRPALAVVKGQARGIFIEESKRILNEEMPKGVK